MDAKEFTKLINQLVEKPGALYGFLENGFDRVWTDLSKNVKEDYPAVEKLYYLNRWNDCQGR